MKIRSLTGACYFLLLIGFYLLKYFIHDFLFDLLAYAFAVIGTVEMLVDPKKLNDVIDKFGTNITIAENDDGRLKITVKASLMGMKYWALQYLEFVEVVGPESLISDIKRSVLLNKY